MKIIPFSPPDITQAEIDAVTDTLRSGWITTGPKTKRFEREIAAYCHTSRAVTMNSATACLEMTLRLFGIGPGDEVITCAYTYTASASVIHHIGAKIVLVDSGKDSYHIDYSAIAAAITPRTKAIIPVDIAGLMCDYDRIRSIVMGSRDLFSPSTPMQAKLGHILVLADAAHSFGAEHGEYISGSAADFTCFSFHAVKNLTTAEGGAVTWRTMPDVDDEEIYRQFLLLSLHGQSKDALEKTALGSWEYDIIAPHYKCNMTDIMASIGLVQLERYPQILERRRQLIHLYNRLLKPLNVTPLCHEGQNFQSCGHLYLMRLNGRDADFRNKVIVQMGTLGVATNVHYKPLPLLGAYRDLGFDIAHYPDANRMYQNELTLPLHTLLTDEDVHYVVDCLSQAIAIVSDYDRPAQRIEPQAPHLEVPIEIEGEYLKMDLGLEVEGEKGV